jgi:predicted amidohydrolase YtcJ
VVLLGGVVRTLDPTRPAARAVALRGAQIAAVGEDQDIQAWIGPATQVVRLAGRAVVPGLVDAHLHFAGLGLRRFSLDLVGTRSLAEIQNKVRAAAKEAPPGGWLVGRGWDQNDWDTPAHAFPTARDLDAVAPDRPVVLTRIDGHALWANGKAMELAGVGPATPAPKGGDILHLEGRPSGIFIDHAMELIRRAVPPRTEAELLQAFRLAEQECLATGLTQVQDMGIDQPELALLRRLDAEGGLKIRVYAMLEGGSTHIEEMMRAGPLLPAGDRARLTVRGVKYYLDGALGSRGAALFQPYRDDPQNSGLAFLEPAEFEARVSAARAHGFQVATHAIGDRANRIALDVYERVYGAAARAERPRVEHAQVLTPEDIPRFGRLGVIASMQPVHATSDMDWAEARVGPERIKGAYAWRSVLAAGGVLAAGSDAPVEEVSPFAGLYAAVTRADAAGKPPGGWRPEERLSPAEALAAFTAGAAFASFREQEAGVIAPGRVADLTVLDADPLTLAEPRALLGLHAELTIIAGEIVYTRR